MGARGKALSEKGKRSRWLRPVLFALFRQKPIETAIPLDSGIDPAIPRQLLLPESASRLLATPRRQHLLEHIWQRTSLSHQQFAALYQEPLERYAELVQQFRLRRRITMPIRAVCWI